MLASVKPKKIATAQLSRDEFSRLSERLEAAGFENPGWDLPPNKPDCIYRREFPGYAIGVWNAMGSAFPGRENAGEFIIWVKFEARISGVGYIRKSFPDKDFPRIALPLSDSTISSGRFPYRDFLAPSNATPISIEYLLQAGRELGKAIQEYRAIVRPEELRRLDKYGRIYRSLRSAVPKARGDIRELHGELMLLNPEAIWSEDDFTSVDTFLIGAQAHLNMLAGKLELAAGVLFGPILERIRQDVMISGAVAEYIAEK